MESKVTPPEKQMSIFGNKASRQDDENDSKAVPKENRVIEVKEGEQRQNFSDDLRAQREDEHGEEGDWGVDGN